MKLEKEKVKSEKLYSVGYCSTLDKHILAIIVPWVAWYKQYFEISEEDYNEFGTENIDAMADFFQRQGTSSPQFLFSDLENENTEGQKLLRDKAKGNKN